MRQKRSDMQPLNVRLKSLSIIDKKRELNFDKKEPLIFDRWRGVLSMSKGGKAQSLLENLLADISWIARRPGENIPDTEDPGKGTPRTLRKSSSQANEPTAHHSCGYAVFTVLAPLWDFTLSGFSLRASSFMRSSQAVSKTARRNGINASLSCSILSCGAKKAGAFWVSIA